MSFVFSILGQVFVLIGVVSLLTGVLLFYKSLKQTDDEKLICQWLGIYTYIQSSLVYLRGAIVFALLGGLVLKFLV